MTDITVGKANGQYYLQAKRGDEQVQMPIPDCKSEKEAQMVRDAIAQKVAEAENAQGGQAPEGSAKMGPPPAPTGAAKQLDMAA